MDHLEQIEVEESIHSSNTAVAAVVIGNLLFWAAAIIGTVVYFH